MHNDNKESTEKTEFNKIYKMCIITGANRGVGLKATEKYAAAGYEVIMACRDQTKAEDAISGIKRTNPDAKLTFMKLDLASLKSVRQFVDEFHAAAKPLHVLCNNAGMTTGFRNGKGPFKTEDGFEVTFGINHLGHFLLTLLLLDDLKKTASEAGEARIVVTASSLHDPDSIKGMRAPGAHLDFDNLQLLEGPYNGELAYKNSKLANVLFTKELARRLGESGVTVNALCPGFIPSTGLIRNESSMKRFMLTKVLYPMFKWKGITRTEIQGGESVYHAGTDPNLKGKTGGYYRDCKETESSVESNDTAVAKKLWDVSAQMVNLEEEKNL
ncbi:retinol dehydrogenase 14-like isoform X2 [Acanthaster planci]|uniref:Retinol dehydrogenase 14-like isoform X2 n=1 Tax=Acanthaster planci TaxID=133434 RepID=A0A8B7YN55_ACAPL|nr:retinol dehydrogenase 14-like isoform X2 [Acanthaster planci]